MQEVFLTIAGSDSCSGAGIQADTKVCQDLGVHALNIVTAITAQNPEKILSLESISDKIFDSQLEALKNSFNIKVVKTGVLATEYQINQVSNYLNSDKNIIYICDPVMVATSGDKLMDEKVKNAFKNILLPRANILTPNLFEAQQLLETEELFSSEPDRLEEVARQLCEKYQVESVLLKGGHAKTNTADDYFYSLDASYWLSTNWVGSEKSVHGTGCTISSAIGAFLIRGYDINNSLVLAKSYIAQSINYAQKLTQQGSLLLKNMGWPSSSDFFTKIYPYKRLVELEFKKLPKIGFYPVVDSSDWILYLAQQGIKTIQLRIKDKSLVEIEAEIKKSIEYQNEYGLQLFINDYYELGLKYKAFGIHLGHEDFLQIANDNPNVLQSLAANDLALGLSTHDYYELSVAVSISPSYIALGPIFPTTTKAMKFTAQGIDRIKEWQSLTDIPLVAIGGIKEAHIKELASTGISGVAAITLITLAKNPKKLLVNIKSQLSKVEELHV